MSDAPKKYEVAREFGLGFAAAVVPTCGRVTTQSSHWLAGWDAGYGFRNAKNERLNDYLKSIGLAEMSVITLAAAATTENKEQK